MSEQHPLPSPTQRAMEIVLEVGNLEQSVRFYRDVLGMPQVTRWGQERPAIWVKAAPGTYLGLWTAQAGGPGVGVKGSRGGAHVHLAFLLPLGHLPLIETRLKEAGYTSSRVEFSAEKLSLFVDDPDGNVIEFADWTRSWENLEPER